MNAPRNVGVAVIGYGWMGQVHARAYARVRHHDPSHPLLPNLVLVADDDADRRAEATRSFDVETTARWADVLADPRVDAVSVTAPNFLHRELGVAVARSGKHLWIEKPVGLSAADTEAVADAVSATGVQSAVGFNYRNAPAVEHARELIAQGAIGRVTNAAVRLLADYAAHPNAPISWRFERARGGNGVLGDLASHGIDLARFLVGEIDEVVADTATFIDERPIRTGPVGHYEIVDVDGSEVGPVENEDYLSCLLRFSSGARGSLEASRVSVGDQNTYGFTVHGTKGQLSWDFRRLGELVTSFGADFLDQHSTTVFVGPSHGEFGQFQPGAAIAMSYDDLKVIEAQRFLSSIAAGKAIGATVTDALAMARVSDAIEESAATRQWTRVRHTG